MATIRITDLSLRAFLGTNDWEKKEKQDVIINISFEYDARRAAKTDDLNDAVDYKSLKIKIIQFVEQSRFNLVERLASEILDIILQDNNIQAATVRIDKPAALRFAKSVSVEMNRPQKNTFSRKAWLPGKK